MNIAKPTILALAVTAVTSLAGLAQADEPACPYYENRSGLCGYYATEVSPAKAFIDTVARRGTWGNPSQRPVILDVRAVSEYKAGHPDHAINAPWPYVFQTCDAQGRTVDGACIKTLSQVPQTVQDFLSFVQSVIPDKNTPIYTLCRTGVRSVGAANVLTDAGYTNVHNVWEGFVGINLKAPKRQADGTIKEMIVDLNHDGVITDEDKNGWRYHQGLPYTTSLLPPLIYQPRADLYAQP